MLPAPGNIVNVRQRQYLVESVTPPATPHDEHTLVRMVCLDDDAQGRSLSVLWERALGYGRSDGGVIPLLAGKAFRDLRLLTSVTGGFCTFVDTAELPQLLTANAQSLLHGAVELRVSVPMGTSAVTGTVTAGGSELPFRF